MAKKIGKTNIINAVTAKFNIPKVSDDHLSATDLVNFMFDYIRAELIAGSIVAIRKLFRMQKKTSSRRMSNPSTGASLGIRSFDFLSVKKSPRLFK